MRNLIKSIGTVLATLAFAAACTDMQTPAPDEQTVAGDFPGHAVTQSAITAQDFAFRVKSLADDRFAGRGPGTPNGEAAADWIAAEMQRVGLTPGNRGSFFQDVPAAALTLDPSASSFEIVGKDGAKSLKFADEVAFWTPRFDHQDQDVKASELVFVGYGVTAPEYQWDDFKGIDVKGKTIVLLINDPGFITGDESMFKGRAMTYYGRWTYKFEEAARRGAAAVIIVHETEPAAYGWQVVRNSNTGAKYYLDKPNGNSDLAVVHSWITTDVAKSLFARAGLNYDELRIAANKHGFRAVSMKGLTLNAHTHSTISKLETRNVIGVVKGSVKPSEYVLYMAHWDHLGVKESVPGNDKIHNGAVDNASGVAAILEMAEAYATAPKRPRRSVMFASVTLEEQGLLGSEYLARHLPVPARKIVAGMNFDGVGPSGPAKDMTVVGSGASELEDMLAAILKTQGRSVSPDPEPEKGSYYRSDHINLSKVGIPMLYSGAGTDLVDGGTAAGLAQRQDYTRNRYHQPSDEFTPDWDLRAAVQTMETSLELGSQIANSDRWPTWYKTSEFRRIRDRSLKSK
ncbi:MAG: M28 family metallopeptidase [Micropepsaceae bacterium]